MLIIFCYNYKHLPFSNMPYQPEINFIENKHLPGFQFIVAFNSMTIYLSKLLGSCIKTRITKRILEELFWKYKIFIKSL